MFEFGAVRRAERTMHEHAAALTLDELCRLTHASLDAFEALLDGLRDGDVTFVPSDPAADDTAAADPADRTLA